MCGLGQCTNQCRRPVNTAGYELVTEHSLTQGSDFSVAVVCADNYANRPLTQAVSCSAGGMEYQLLGCHPD